MGPDHIFDWQLFKVVYVLIGFVEAENIWVVFPHRFAWKAKAVFAILFRPEVCRLLFQLFPRRGKQNRSRTSKYYTYTILLLNGCVTYVNSLLRLHISNTEFLLLNERRNNSQIFSQVSVERVYFWIDRNSQATCADRPKLFRLPYSCVCLPTLAWLDSTIYIPF